MKLTPCHRHVTASSRVWPLQATLTICGFKSDASSSRTVITTAGPSARLCAVRTSFAPGTTCPAAHGDGVGVALGSAWNRLGREGGGDARTWDPLPSCAGTHKPTTSHAVRGLSQSPRSCTGSLGVPGSHGSTPVLRHSEPCWL